VNDLAQQRCISHAAKLTQARLVVNDNASRRRGELADKILANKVPFR
jgi:hypothetical protein